MLVATQMRAAVSACVQGLGSAELDAQELAFTRAAERLGDAFRAVDERRRHPECQSVASVRRANDAIKAELDAQAALLQRHRGRLERWSGECDACRELALRSYPGAPGTDAAVVTVTAAPGSSISDGDTATNER